MEEERQKRKSARYDGGKPAKRDAHYHGAAPKRNRAALRKRRKRRQMRRRLAMAVGGTAAALAVILVILLGIRIFTGKSIQKVEEMRLTAASMDHSAWIRDGRVNVAGEPYENQDTVKEWTDLVQVSVSDAHIVALDQRGTVHAAGANGSLQCEINGLEDVCYIETGMNCSLGVMNDGSIQVFGILDEVRREALKQEKDAVSVAMGEEHIAILHSDGTVTACGENRNGQCNVRKWKRVCQIAVGNGFTLGLTEKGKVLFAGNVGYNISCFTGMNRFSQIAAGNNSILGIDADGKLWAAGTNLQGECDVEEWKDIISMAAGYDHTIGLCSSGDVYAAGYNGNGQCNVQL